MKRKTLRLRNEAILAAARGKGFVGKSGSLSVNALAAASGVSPMTIYRLLRRQRRVSDSAIFRVASVLGISPEVVEPPGLPDADARSEFGTIPDAASSDHVSFIRATGLTPSPASALEVRDMAERVLACMLPREAEVCRRRVQGDTLEEIGEDLGVTRERVRQLEMKGYERARRDIRRLS